LRSKERREAKLRADPCVRRSFAGGGGSFSDRFARQGSARYASFPAAPSCAMGPGGHAMHVYKAWYPRVGAGDLKAAWVI
jgi:hypothetical protein